MHKTLHSELLLTKGMIDHTIYMKRCLELAQLGQGYVAPNPMVGCVIVSDSEIIGEGYHNEYGKAHAEVNAIQSVKDIAKIQNATIYVNLEPCSHWGKTPPCSDLIIKHRIPNVVIGSIDSHLKVAGQGIEQLKKAGINVVVGVLEDECRTLNKRFFSFHENHRPYIILKWAETKDGFIDIASHLKNSQKGLWITNDKCRKLVHKWRAEEGAIMVGTNTAIIDNPQLTTREWTGNNPIRVSIDKSNRFPKHLHILDNTVKTLIFTQTEIENQANVEYIKQTKVDVHSIIKALYKNKIQSILVEGGTTLLQSFIDSNMWDEARVFIGDKFFVEGVKAPNFNQQYSITETIDETILHTYYNSK